MQLYDGSAAPVLLGRQIARGGEGTVLEITGSPTYVAKVYHAPIAPNKRTKLEIMARAATSGLLGIAAWPTDTLYSAPNGDLVGIVLPRIIGHREIHELYSPVQRKLSFAKADWAFLLHVAMNCAAAFETVHEGGYVIGDVNQGGVLVSTQGTVNLIDCDSFQVRRNGTVYYCTVGVPQYTPPELQGLTSFDGVIRSQAHDCFGLALLAFHLLFMGRHPYAGRFNGSGEMPIERAIKEGRFAFGAVAASNQMSPPPYALPFEALPATLRLLFERSFGRAIPLSVVNRPSAREWRETISAARRDLKRCPTDSTHAYFSHLGDCPWCQIEHRGGPAFFMSLLATPDFDPNFDLNRVCQLIQFAPRPPELSRLKLTTEPAGLIALAIPHELRFDLLPEEKNFPSDPIWEPELEPTLQVPIVELVPDDPPFISEALPSLPVLRSGRYRERALADYLRARQFTDYRVAKWGTVVFAVVATMLLLWFPPAAVGAAVFGGTFATAWACLYVPLRRDFRRNLKRAEAEANAERARFAEAVATYEAAEARIQANNSIRYSQWQRLIADLGVRRKDAAARHAQRIAGWAVEAQRVTALAARIRARNEDSYRIYQEQLQTVRRRRQEIYRVNSAKAATKQRFLIERGTRADRLRNAEAKIEAIRKNWEIIVTSVRDDYNRKYARLREARSEYEQLQDKFNSDYQQLLANRHAIQLKDFLSQVLISAASIPGVGKTRKALLAFHGIETAQDISESLLADIPGIGRVIIRELVVWRDRIAGGFVFDARKAIPQQELRSLHMRYHVPRRRLQQELSNGAQNLAQVCKIGDKRREQLLCAAKPVSAAVAQARADLSIMDSIMPS